MKVFSLLMNCLVHMLKYLLEKTMKGYMELSTSCVRRLERWSSAAMGKREEDFILCAPDLLTCKTWKDVLNRCCLPKWSPLPPFDLFWFCKSGLDLETVTKENTYLRGHLWQLPFINVNYKLVLCSDYMYSAWEHGCFHQKLWRSVFCLVFIFYLPTFKTFSYSWKVYWPKLRWYQFGQTAYILLLTVSNGINADFLWLLSCLHLNFTVYKTSNLVKHNGAINILTEVLSRGMCLIIAMAEWLIIARVSGWYMHIHTQEKKNSACQYAV